MHVFGKWLSRLGAHGPILLVASLGIGAFSARLSHAGYSLLPASAFLLTLGSFLTAGLASFETKVRRSCVGLILAWLLIAIPVIGLMATQALPLDPALRAGVLLSLLAPPVGSAAAIAAMLGLQPRLALLSSIALTLIAPLSMPLLARVFNLDVQMDMGVLALRLVVIIGAAALIAFASLRAPSVIKSILPDQSAGTGVAVIGLVIVGLATAEGVRAHWLADAAGFDRMLGAAFAINIGVCAIGAAAFSWLGWHAAATIGLVSGNRNVTLAWAAAGVGLPTLAEGYIAACVVPVLALPLIIKIAVSLLGLCNRLAFRFRPQGKGNS